MSECLSYDWRAGLSRNHGGAVELRLIGTKWTAVRVGAQYIVCYDDEELARVDSMPDAVQFIETTRNLEGL